MTAWELMLENSSAPNGSTAWVHLNSQIVGTAGAGLPFPVQEVVLELEEPTLNTNTLEDAMSLDIIDTELSVVFNTDTLTLEEV